MSKVQLITSQLGTHLLKQIDSASSIFTFQSIREDLLTFLQPIRSFSWISVQNVAQFEKS
jgi:hypothetical protein